MYKKLVCLMFVVLVAASMFGCNLFDFGKKETREAAEKEEKISEQIKELENNSEKLSIGNFYEIYALMDERLPGWKLLRRKLNKREFEPKLPTPPKPVRLIQSDFTATLFG